MNKPFPSASHNLHQDLILMREARMRRNAKFTGLVFATLLFLAGVAVCYIIH